MHKCDNMPPYKVKGEHCTLPNICSCFSFGMHKCDNLPPYKVKGEHCTLPATALKYNKSACVNWNQVSMQFNILQTSRK